VIVKSRAAINHICQMKVTSMRTLASGLFASALIFSLGGSQPIHAVAQNAAPSDRNAVNTAARPGDMLADSPVTFPNEGALPAKYPPEVEILLATGAFGTADPRDPVALARAPHSGTGPYGKALKALAAEERCAYLDMTKPWAEYIRSSNLDPHISQPGVAGNKVP